MKRMAALVRKLPVNMVLLAASYSAASAAAIPFTWDPSRSIPGLAVPGSSFTADTINTTNYLYSINQANGSFVEQFIVRVNSFELNGQPVSAPGLNSSYGLYFSISATGQGSLFNNLD